MNKPLIFKVRAYNLPPNEQLEVVRHFWKPNITKRFSSKTTHYRWGSPNGIAPESWHKMQNMETVDMFIFGYNIDDRRLVWLKEQIK